MVKCLGGLFENRFRFIMIPFLIIILKILGSILVYSNSTIPMGNSFWMNPDTIFPVIQNDVLLDSVNPSTIWAYTFVGWDTAWYLSIAVNGYGFSDQSFAFRPLFPLISRFLMFFGLNPIYSVVVTGLIFGVLWIPIFQLVAEEYMDKFSAFFVTTIFSTSPFTFLFTTVAYSEGLFLFLTLGAWLYFRRGKYYLASIFSFFSAFSRIPGVLISVPMILDGVKNPNAINYKKVVTGFFPILSLVLWSFFCYFSAGDFYASFNVSEWNLMYSFGKYLLSILPILGIKALSFPHVGLQLIGNFAPFIWLYLILPPFLLSYVYKMDRVLFVYSLLYYVIILLFGSVASSPRFLSFLFPIWLAIDFSSINKHHKQGIVLLISLISFYISIYLWNGFISGYFVS
jgi:hypothetical protein